MPAAAGVVVVAPAPPAAAHEGDGAAVAAPPPPAGADDVVQLAPQQQQLQAKAMAAKTIDVFCRVRPPIKHDQPNNTEGELEQRFGRSRFFGSGSTNADVFARVASPLVQHVLAGGFATLFAYGMTGSGKSHTMASANDADEGLILCSVRDLFRRVEAAGETLVAELGFFEVYRNKPVDLLPDLSIEEKKRPKVRIAPPAGDSGEGVARFPGLRRLRVRDFQDFKDMFLRGSAARCVAKTRAHNESSRGHAVVILDVQIRPAARGDVANANDAAAADDDGAAAGEVEAAHLLPRIGRLVFVDLAGYERFGAEAGKEKGVRKLEGKAINKSLAALGTVVDCLAKSGANGHVPWRDAALTMGLWGCIGGAARSAIVLTVVGHSDFYRVTLATVQFGDSAAGVRVSLTQLKPTSKQVIASLQVALLAASLKITDLKRRWALERRLTKDPQAALRRGLPAGLAACLRLMALEQQQREDANKNAAVADANLERPDVPFAAARAAIAVSRRFIGTSRKQVRLDILHRTGQLVLGYERDMLQGDFIDDDINGDDNGNNDRNDDNAGQKKVKALVKSAVLRLVSKAFQVAVREAKYVLSEVPGHQLPIVDMIAFLLLGSTDLALLAALTVLGDVHDEFARQPQGAASALELANSLRALLLLACDHGARCESGRHQGVFSIIDAATAAVEAFAKGINNQNDHAAGDDHDAEVVNPGVRAYDRFMEMMEDYVEDHKAKTLQSAILQPLRFLYNLANPGAEAQVEMHGVNWVLYLFTHGLGIAMPQKAHESDQYIGGFTNYPACIPQALRIGFTAIFRDPTNFGRSFEHPSMRVRLAAMPPDELRDVVYRPVNPRIPQPPIHFGTMLQLNVLLRTTWSSAVETISGFFSTDFFVRKALETLNSETKPEHAGFRSHMRTLYSVFRQQGHVEAFEAAIRRRRGDSDSDFEDEEGSEESSSDDDDDDDDILDDVDAFCYTDDSYAHVAVDRVAYFFRWLGVLSPVPGSPTLSREALANLDNVVNANREDHDDGNENEDDDDQDLRFQHGNDDADDGPDRRNEALHEETERLRAELASMRQERDEMKNRCQRAEGIARRALEAQRGAHSAMPRDDAKRPQSSNGAGVRLAAAGVMGGLVAGKVGPPITEGTADYVASLLACLGDGAGKRFAFTTSVPPDVTRAVIALVQPGNNNNPDRNGLALLQMAVPKWSDACYFNPSECGFEGAALTPQIKTRFAQLAKNMEDRGVRGLVTIEGARMCLALTAAYRGGPAATNTPTLIASWISTFTEAVDLIVDIAVEPLAVVGTTDVVFDQRSVQERWKEVVAATITRHGGSADDVHVATKGLIDYGFETAARAEAADAAVATIPGALEL